MEDTTTTQQELAAAKRQIQELKSRLEKVTDFIENASTPLHWVNKDAIIVWANQAELDMLGYSREEYIGQSIEKFHVDKKNIQTILQRLQQHEVVHNFPSQLICKDGSIRDVIINSSVYEEHGEFIHTRCFTRDITALKKEEEQKTKEKIQASRSIEESEIRFRLAIEAAEMGVFDWDLSAQTFFCSPRLIEIFGFSDPSTTHLDLINALHPDDKPLRDRAVEDAYSKGSLVYEARVIWPDKSIHWVRVYGKIMHDQQKQVKRMFGIVTDITEQKEAELVLKEDVRKIRIILESLPQMAWTAYPNGVVNYFSESWYEFTGLTQKEELMEGWNSVWHPDLTQQAKESWAKAVREGTPYEMENLARRASDGTYRWMSVKAIPLKNAEGDILLWVGSITDIHEQKTFAEKLEQKINERTRQLKRSQMDLAELNNILAEKNFELEKQNSELTSFTYIASHDLQEPIRKIHTFSQMLLDRERAQLTPTSIDYLNRISSSSVRMKQLVEAFLSYSRIGNASMTLETIDLNNLLKEVTNALSETILEKQAVLEIDSLPVIQGSTIQLQQLFINLIGNALKYSKPHVRPLIQIRAEKVPDTAVGIQTGTEDSDYWHLSISDNGIGFSQEHATKIFEVFQRLHNKDEYAGTGIGLSICKKIVQAHKGFITATGNPGVGSVFSIYLPVKP
jgi:PAS domain S-box-containing protein